MILFWRVNIFGDHEPDQHHDREGHDEQDDEPIARFNCHAASGREPGLNRDATKYQFVTFHHAAM
jgi:hypothetical protein